MKVNPTTISLSIGLATLLIGGGTYGLLLVQKNAIHSNMQQLAVSLSHHLGNGEDPGFILKHDPSLFKSSGILSFNSETQPHSNFSIIYNIQHPFFSLLNNSYLINGEVVASEKMSRIVKAKAGPLFSFHGTATRNGKFEIDYLSEGITVLSQENFKMETVVADISGEILKTTDRFLLTYRAASGELAATQTTPHIRYNNATLSLLRRDLKNESFAFSFNISEMNSRLFAARDTFFNMNLTPNNNTYNLEGSLGIKRMNTQTTQGINAEVTYSINNIPRQRIQEINTLIEQNQQYFLPTGSTLDTNPELEKQVGVTILGAIKEGAQINISDLSINSPASRLKLDFNFEAPKTADNTNYSLEQHATASFNLNVVGTKVPLISLFIANSFNSTDLRSVIPSGQEIRLNLDYKGLTTLVNSRPSNSTLIRSTLENLDKRLGLPATTKH